MSSLSRHLQLASTILAMVLVAGSADVKLSEAQPAQTSSPTKPNPGEGLQGKKLVEATCAACHSLDGNSTSPQIPKIAGQNADYIREQLRAFKSGTLKSDIMSAAVSGLTDAQIVELARYFSGQEIKPDSVGDSRLASIGARIFQYPSSAAPPCAACHGGGGFGPGGMMGGHMGMMGGHMGMMMGGHMGMMGGHMGMMMGGTGPVPNLSGQHAAYILQQLDAFGSGARAGTVMGSIARSLNERDRRAVAEYLSGRR